MYMGAAEVELESDLFARSPALGPGGVDRPWEVRPVPQCSVPGCYNNAKEEFGRLTADEGGHAVLDFVRLEAD